MSADNSYATRIYQLRARTMAAYHQQNPGVRDLAATDGIDSALVQRQVGTLTYVVQPTTNPRYEDRSCCATPACEAVGPVSNIQITNNDGLIFVDDPAFLNWSAVPGATSYSISVVQTEGDLPFSVTYNYIITGPTSATLTLTSISGGSWAVQITVTANNECSSSNSSIITGPCFLAGSLVAMADGSSKPIEEVQIGDIVIGAFGKHNPVLALHRPLLGKNRMCKINNEHSTSSHHPHISVDKKFYCAHPAVASGATYGREHEVIVEDNKKEMRMLHGLAPERIQELHVGVELKTIEGSRKVNEFDIYEMPEDTQLYNLVIGGSHTYHVDGYAVTGWPREDDFDYDTWSPK
jgi:hypothetical protein